jgi:hypothetical protein
MSSVVILLIATVVTVVTTVTIVALIMLMGMSVSAVISIKIYNHVDCDIHDGNDIRIPA